MKYAVYAKGIIAAIGLALTGCVSLFAPHTTAWDAITVIAVVLTAIGVVKVPNADPPATVVTKT